jgi:hypothetical protein
MDRPELAPHHTVALSHPLHACACACLQVPEEFLGRLNSRMQMVLQNLAEEEGKTSPSSSPQTRAEPAAAADGAAAGGGASGDWDDANRQRWQVRLHAPQARTQADRQRSRVPCHFSPPRSLPWVVVVCLAHCVCVCVCVCPQDILTRLSAEGVDPVSLRGASLRR